MAHKQMRFWHVGQLVCLRRAPSYSTLLPQYTISSSFHIMHIPTYCTSSGMQYHRVQFKLQCRKSTTAHHSCTLLGCMQSLSALSPLGRVHSVKVYMVAHFTASANVKLHRIFTGVSPQLISFLSVYLIPIFNIFEIYTFLSTSLIYNHCLCQCYITITTFTDRLKTDLGLALSE